MMAREDYIEVSERIQKFYEKHPDGSLQGGWGWLTDERNVLVYRAEAYRDRDDTRPGVGYASEPYPGLTSFTRNSEIMNAETSAWGRSLASLGIAVHRGIASAQEVRAAQRGTDVVRVKETPPDDPWYAPPTQSGPLPEVGHKIVGASKIEAASDKQLKMIMAKMSGLGISEPSQRLAYVNAVLVEGGLDQVGSAKELTKFTAGKVIDALMVGESAPVVEQTSV